MSPNGFQFGLACFILAAFTGLAGFMIVYHYATFERPLQQFAIVTDAGSTQTRSSLFTVAVDSASFNEWADKDNSKVQSEESIPLKKLFQVRQVDTCLNGGPLASLQSESDATKLTMKCLKRFSQRIKRLDFIANNDMEPGEGDQDEDESGLLEIEEISDRMAKLNHRVNSVTHLYLGATAGMRALSQVNATRAHEKIQWMDRALNDSNRLLKNGPYINKAFFDIIDGSDEALFGWISVNFVCDNLEAKHRKRHTDMTTAYSIANASGSALQQQPDTNQKMLNATDTILSVGTLELGGASAQMAYQVSERLSGDQIASSGLEPKQLRLFNDEYKLATRSDLCLGMSQAILRTNYVILRTSFKSYSSNKTSSIIELKNACMQNRSITSFSGSQLAEIFRAPCLAASKLDASDQVFRNFVSNSEEVRFTGTGNVTECDDLLSDLIEPESCKTFFSLCPTDKNRIPPTSKMPFVTISGYNKALAVLNLKKGPATQDNKLDQVIADNLGGYPIDQQEYVNLSKEFCSTDVAEFPAKFPKMNKAYYSVNCLQLVYINKLLIEFYLFDPGTSWNQIKFLLFPVKPKQSQTVEKETDKNDIGWTLGLLLNATSQDLANHSDNSSQRSIFYHHGSSILFIVRTTMFLMLACTLMAVGLIGFAIITVQRKRRCGEAYMNRSYEDSI